MLIIYNLAGTPGQALANDLLAACNQFDTVKATVANDAEQFANLNTLAGVSDRTIWLLMVTRSDVDTGLPQNLAEKHPSPAQRMVLVIDDHATTPISIPGYAMVRRQKDFFKQWRELHRLLGFEYVVPRSFASFIADRRQDFTGRGFVFEKIETFLSDHSSGYFFLSGYPGMGKSAILSEFINRTDCLAHFIIRAEGRNRTGDFLTEINLQLKSKFGLSFAFSQNDPIQTFYGLLHEVSKMLDAKNKLIIVIDGLDELDVSGQAVNTNPLFLPLTLPPYLYFVISQRPIDIDLQASPSPIEFNLEKYGTENQGDIEKYLTVKLAEPAYAAWLRSMPLPKAAIVRELTLKSDTNFMYIRYVLPDLLDRKANELDIANLPVGLLQYYHSHWRKMGMETSPIPQDKILLIYFLSVFKTALSAKMLNQYSGLSKMLIEEVLDEWKEFLKLLSRPDGKYYSIYHASFQEFLHSSDVIRYTGQTLQKAKILAFEYYQQRLKNV